MKSLILVATFLVAVKAFPFNFSNATLPGNLLNSIRNATLDVFHTKMAADHDNIMKCFNAEQLEVFKSCRPAKMRGQRRGHRGGHRDCGNSTVSSTEAPAVPSSPVNATRRRRSPSTKTPPTCFLNCILQKMDALNSQGNVVVSGLQNWIDKANISASQKTVAKTSLETCMNSNFTLLNDTQFHGLPALPPFPGLHANGSLPFFGVNGTRPFPGNGTRPFPKPNPTCMKSGKALMCMSRALLENGCAGLAAGNKAAAMTLASSFAELNESEDDEASLSDEEYEEEHSAAMKQKSSRHTSSEEEESGSGRHRQRSGNKHGQKNGGRSHENEESKNGEKHGESGHHSKSRGSGKGEREGGHHEDGKGNGQHNGSRNQNGHRSENPKGNEENDNEEKQNVEDESSAETVTEKSKERKRGTRSALENIEEANLTEDASSSSESNSQSHEDGINDNKNLDLASNEALLPGINIGRNPSAGRPGVGLKG